MTEIFSEDQYDALREISNIAMGRASRALAMLLNLFVELSVPDIIVLDADQVGDRLRSLGGCEQGVAAVRQSFFGGMSGEVISLHTRGSSTDIVDLLGYQGKIDAAKEREFLLDVSNLLSGAVLNGISQQLGIEIGFSPPSLIEERVQLDELKVDQDAAWTHALFSQVHFQFEEREFASRLLIFLPDRSFATIRKAVDDFLDDL